MRCALPGRRPAQRLCWYIALAATLPAGAWSQSTAPESEFVYHARARDTLIGIGRRLLLEPHRWPEVQTRNHIVDPRRLPVGDVVRIPYAWLRMSPDTAAVTAVGGEVAAGTSRVRPGQMLAEGSQIQTGSDGSVTLTLADGSVITLQKSTALSLEEMRRVTGVPSAHDTRLKLQSGRLQTQIKPQGDAGRFEIQTPVAVSAVRGTQFRSAFTPQAGSAITETLEGTVAVSGSTATLAVPADFGTRVEHDAAPLPPRRLLPPPDLRGLADINTSGRLRLQWPAVSGAVSYRIQLAPDAEFHSFLLDAQSTAAQIDLPAPPDGGYWLRVRSIDDLGLEGQDAVKTLAQHRLATAPTLATPLPGVTVVGDAAVFTWLGLEPGVRYRLQIARNADFTDLLLERDAGEATQLNIDPIPPGHYFWRVGGIDARGQAGDWSPAQDYVQRQTAPTPYSPSFVAREMQVHWDPQNGARYRVQVARDPGFRSTILDRALDVPTLSMRRPWPGVYYARVQTIAEDGSTVPFGKTVMLDVPAPRWVKILLPVLTLLTFIR
ncbi:MAG TPA: FecR domain-containing protein [Steroidobacteraceae bacterium]|nr:FecR domain-containing protein [Steroidobacteraceae bacterium]